VPRLRGVLRHQRVVAELLEHDGARRRQPAPQVDRVRGLATLTLERDEVAMESKLPTLGDSTYTPQTLVRQVSYYHSEGSWFDRPFPTVLGNDLDEGIHAPRE